MPRNYLKLFDIFPMMYPRVVNSERSSRKRLVLKILLSIFFISLFFAVTLAIGLGTVHVLHLLFP